MSCNSVAIAGLFLIKRGKAVKAKARRMLKKEKKGSKKIIMTIIVVIILLLIIGAVIFFMHKNFNKPEEKTDLLEDKEVFGMELKNITIEKQGEVYVFKAQIENTLNEKFEKQPVQIIFSDEKNQKVLKYQYVILDLEKGETQNIEIKTSEPLNEFYTFEIKKVV